MKNGYTFRLIYPLQKDYFMSDTKGGGKVIFNQNMIERGWSPTRGGVLEEYPPLPKV